MARCNESECVSNSLSIFQNLQEDGFDETLIPLDFKTEGQIVDDDLLDMLIKPLKAGVHTTVLVDCCHAGTVFDLPYVFGANDDEMHRENGFDFQDGDKPIDLEYDKPKKKTKTPEEEEKKQKKKKKQQQNKKPPEEFRDAPISDITEPQRRPNSAPPPPPPSSCCVVL
jgi:hypothetical protein